jgi:hypothetical protein
MNRLLRSAIDRLLLLTLLAALQSCGNPLDIDTPRRITRVNIDSLISTDTFIHAPGDSIFAHVDDNEVVFATEVLRPLFHNGYIHDAYYITVQASRYGLNSPDYEVMSLRLDDVRDTGTYQFNAGYSAPKQIDTLQPPQFGASYERRINGGFPEAYTTGDARAAGSVHVVKIDEDRGVMVGTFSFTGYNAERDSIVAVDRGAFRLQLKKK